MRRLTIVFLLLLIILGAVAAEAGIETPNYSFKLGHYDKTTDKYHVGAGKAWWDNEWKKGWYWTDGPWSIYVGGTPLTGGVRVGSIINFSDVLLSTNNGYPLVGSDKWNAWITTFGGEPGYVLGELNSDWKHLSWKITTPANGDKLFANLAKIAELCGGMGDVFDNKDMYSTFKTSAKPTSSLTVDQTAIRPGQTVKFTITGTTNTYYGQYMYVSFAGGGTSYYNDQRVDGKNISLTQNVTLETPGTYTFTLRLKDSVMRQAAPLTKIVSVIPPEQPIVVPSQPTEVIEPPPVTPDVNQLPIAQFDWPSSAYAGENVAVNEYSVDYDGSIVDKDWDLSTTDAIKIVGVGRGNS